MVAGTPTTPAAELVANGTMPMAVLDAAEVLLLRARGEGVTAFFATFQTSPFAIIVKEPSPWSTLEDMWGSKTVVLANASTPRIAWLNHLYGGGALAFLPYSGSLSPFLAGTAGAMQGFSTSEPLQLAYEGTPVRTMLIADTGFNP